MTWDLVDAKVDLHGSLSVRFLCCNTVYSHFIGIVQFAPNIQFWLNANNTYRVVFIQVLMLSLKIQPARTNRKLRPEPSIVVRHYRE